MNLFLYLDRDSPVHRLDPRTKLFLMLGSFAVAVLFFAPTPLLLLLGVYPRLLLDSIQGGVAELLARYGG